MSHNYPSSRKKVLFFAEAVTLAHMARPAVLADMLDSVEFEAIVARDPRYVSLFPDLQSRQIDLYSIPSADFVEALAKGRPLYSALVLDRYVEEDLRIIDEERPDIVVGDFRLSLAISARLRDIPYVSISNAYWSPHARVPYTIPEHPLCGQLGVGVADRLFKVVRPLVFALHSLPLNRVRRRYGLKFLGLNLKRVYTEADQVVYADVPQLVHIPHLPRSHHFIGPVTWSPEHRYPPWWEEIDQSLPCVYVTLGSSGRSDLLPLVVDAVGSLPVQLMVSTAGQVQEILPAKNVFVADYLPGEAAARRSSLVICNGGSLTTYQAFAHGRPVLGIAGNLDQHLNMTAIERFGAGIRLRTDQLSREGVQLAVTRLLEGYTFSQQAGVLREYVSQTDIKLRFVEVLKAI